MARRVKHTAWSQEEKEEPDAITAKLRRIADTLDDRLIGAPMHATLYHTHVDGSRCALKGCPSYAAVSLSTSIASGGPETPNVSFFPFRERNPTGIAGSGLPPGGW